MAESTISWVWRILPGRRPVIGYTFNAWEGCVGVSPACDNCYAEARDVRLHRHQHWGKDAPRFFHTEDYWKNPLRWNEEAKAAGERRSVFCYSLGDWLEDRPDVTRIRLRFFDLVAHCGYLDFLMLTKRPQNFRPVMLKTIDDGHQVRASLPEVEHYWDGIELARRWLGGEAIPNLWPGSTVESPDYYWRIERLAEIPAPVRFLSCEPLLDELQLTKNLPGQGVLRWYAPMLHLVDWVLAGGESGPRARPSHVDWFRRLRDDCERHNKAFHYKQTGTHIHESQLKDCEEAREVVERAKPKTLAKITHLWPDGSKSYKIGATKTGRMLDGQIYDGFPAPELKAA